MVIVHDIGLAAYIKAVKSIPYSQGPSKDENGRFVFTFELDDTSFADIRLEYLNSTYRRFDLEVKALKKTLNHVDAATASVK